MSGYTLSPKAQADLENIWDYTAKRWNDDQAEAYLRAIKEACQRLALAPRLGRACDDLRAGYFRTRSVLTCCFSAAAKPPSKSSAFCTGVWILAGISRAAPATN